jgi:hypothetical protein
MEKQNFVTYDTGEKYIPGVCNIGPEEIKRRRNAALISGVIVVAEIILLLVYHVNPLWRLSLILPATSLGIGFLQVFLKFCVGFGRMGVFNFDKVGKVIPVEEKENLEKDHKKSRQMTLMGLAFGVVCGIIFYLI